MFPIYRANCPHIICCLFSFFLHDSHITSDVFKICTVLARFCALCSIALVHVSVFIPVPYCFDYYSLLYTLKSGSVMPPALLFLFNIVLAVQIISLSHINFRNFFYFCEKCHWNFDRQFTEFVYFLE